VIITGSTDQCKSGSAPKEFTSPGAKLETRTLQGDDNDKSPIVRKN
jgi:hypothetical protein